MHIPFGEALLIVETHQTHNLVHVSLAGNWVNYCISEIPFQPNDKLKDQGNAQIIEPSL